MLAQAAPVIDKQDARLIPQWVGHVSERPELRLASDHPQGHHRWFRLFVEGPEVEVRITLLRLLRFALVGPARQLESVDVFRIPHLVFVPERGVVPHAQEEFGRRVAVGEVVGAERCEARPALTTHKVDPAQDRTLSRAISSDQRRQ